jgi:hypothetical protein
VVEVTISCNPDGTVHWTTIVRNSSNCAVAGTYWGAVLEVRRNGSSNYLHVKADGGRLTFAPGNTILSGDFCYAFPGNTAAMRVRFGLADTVHNCYPYATSPSVAPCSVRPLC